MESKHGWLKLHRNTELLLEIARKRPTALTLYLLIAMRARYTDDGVQHETEIGEAIVGKGTHYGATDREYRTDIRYLEKMGLITAKATPQGTFAKLTTIGLCEIEVNKIDTPKWEQATHKRHATDTPPTPNIERENDKKINYHFKKMEKENKGTDIQHSTLPEATELSQARINEGMQSLRETLKAKGILKK